MSLGTFSQKLGIVNTLSSRDYLLSTNEDIEGIRELLLVTISPFYHDSLSLYAFIGNDIKTKKSDYREDFKARKNYINLNNQLEEILIII